MEPNFHELYMRFVECLNAKEYAAQVLLETYSNIKVIWIFMYDNFYSYNEYLSSLRMESMERIY